MCKPQEWATRILCGKFGTLPDGELKWNALGQPLPCDFDICCAYLFCVFMWWTSCEPISDRRLSLAPRPLLAFGQSAHVPRIPVAFRWIRFLFSRAFLRFVAFTRIIVWWHWRTQLRRISPISGLVETRGTTNWGKVTFLLHINKRAHINAVAQWCLTQ